MESAHTLMWPLACEVAALRQPPAGYPIGNGPWAGGGWRSSGLCGFASFHKGGLKSPNAMADDASSPRSCT